jgi:hypothetical protein
MDENSKEEKERKSDGKVQGHCNIRRVHASALHLLVLIGHRRFCLTSCGVVGLYVYCPHGWMENRKRRKERKSDGGVLGYENNHRVHASTLICWYR